jgi:hypothetical protein
MRDQCFGIDGENGTLVASPRLPLAKRPQVSVLDQKLNHRVEFVHAGKSVSSPNQLVNVPS